jgi:chromosomal replication initiation ATPase DnaA
VNDQVSDARTVRLHRALEDTRRLLLDHIDRTIGELQHALTRASASRIPLGNQLAEVAWQELVGNDPEPEVEIHANTVMTVTAEFYGFTPNEFRSTRGAKSLCRARHIAMHLCRELTELSLPEIGREFDRDHTTVMHGDRIRCGTSPAWSEAAPLWTPRATRGLDRHRGGWRDSGY